MRWALLFGNFVIGCGVMVVLGTLNDIAQSLAVSVSVAGQLFAVAAAVMCFGAPLLAVWVGGLDRRKLLAAALAWYAVGHALCALMPSYAALLPMRALTMLAAAVFTPQAAAAIGFMTAPEHRGGAITFIFLGWSLASVLGMPASAWLGDTFGWRIAFFAVAALAALRRGLGLCGRCPPASGRRRSRCAAWSGALADPVLMAMVPSRRSPAPASSRCSPTSRLTSSDVIGASTGEASLLLVWFGAFGVIGNMARRATSTASAPSARSCRAGRGRGRRCWPGRGAGMRGRPRRSCPGRWAVRVDSLQQARLGAAAPTLALGADRAEHVGDLSRAGRGRLERRLADRPPWLRPLSWVGLGWIVAAIALSVWAARRAAHAA